MISKIRNLFKIDGDIKDSVIFWNIMYYVILGVSALINLELAQGLYFISSILSIAFILDSDELKYHFWAYTTLPFLFVFLIGGCGFIIIYPIYRLVKWVNSVVDGETCLKHKFGQISKTPNHVIDRACASSYPITIKCDRCGKIKETTSGLKIGVRYIIEENESYEEI